MMVIWKMTTGKHIQKRCLSRAGLRLLLLLLIFSLVACYPATYREVPAAKPAPKPPMTQVYFYPKMGQTTDQQSRDQYECYNWAMQQTGFDPSQSSIPPERRVKVVAMPPPGHNTAVLAIAGAVLGALIAGPRHAGAGALIGAGSGAVVGATSDISREQYAQQMDEAYNRNDQALDARYEGKARDFRRAMGACLEGRGYSVK
ncbi:MAG: glycine zipper family protein [Deltaproteobacteria bacterium HGW-Deltaproteobacteria-12]|jgi:outer membrane lipoprotein SlyB|nr:MAG: glycine zipper family protein [Deltaproteobacteria bacterium HGW-Deltaproteobacteria-12]